MPKGLFAEVFAKDEFLMIGEVRVEDGLKVMKITDPTIHNLVFGIQCRTLTFGMGVFHVRTP
jgi:hypothetical protein